MTNLYAIDGKTIFPVLDRDSRQPTGEYVSFDALYVDHHAGIANMNEKIVRTKDEYEAQGK